MALPDVLLLPEIAKLYCVTVDDLYKEHSAAYANYAQRLAAVYEQSRNINDFVRADLEFQKLRKSGLYTTDDLRVHGILCQYLMQECKEKAIHLFDEIIKNGVEADESVYFQTKQQRAYLLSEIGESKKVIDEQLTITSKANCHAMEWVVLVAAAFCAGEFLNAYTYFQNAIACGVDKAELYCYGGDICCELKEYEEAFVYWDKAIALDDSVMAAKYSKASCYEKLGEYEKAKEVWEDIMKQLEKMGLDIEIKCVRQKGNEFMDTMCVNKISYKVIKLLGKGKGGYSYLVTDGEKKYVLKQIHHEPCDYYTFGNKIEAEQNDYQRLLYTGIRIPKMLDIDIPAERILKEYIDGPTIFDLVKEDKMKDTYLEQMHRMAAQVYAHGLNIDYFPTNLVVQDDLIYYIDYECNNYMEEWNFENWGIKYWSKTQEFMDYVEQHK